jgi:hypothetical protein
MRIGRLHSSGVVVALALSFGLTASAPAQDSGAFPGWNLAYRLPAGWFVRQTAGRVHVLGSQGGPGAIFVAPGLYEHADDVLPDLDAFYRLARISARPTEARTDTTLAGLPAVLATLSGQSEHGRPVSTRVAAVFSPYGTGIVVLGVAAPGAFPKMKSTVESLAATVAARPADVRDDAARELNGLWLRFRDGQPPNPERQQDEMRSIEETIEFAEGGRFVWKSSIFLGAEARGQADDPTTTAGESERGIYRVIGGFLVLKGQQGQRVYPFTRSDGRLSLDGATYYRRD